MSTGCRLPPCAPPAWRGVCASRVALVCAAQLCARSDVSFHKDTCLRIWASSPHSRSAARSSHSSGSRSSTRVRGSLAHHGSPPGCTNMRARRRSRAEYSRIQATQLQCVTAEYGGMRVPSRALVGIQEHDSFALLGCLAGDGAGGVEDRRRPRRQLISSPLVVNHGVGTSALLRERHLRRNPLLRLLRAEAVARSQPLQLGRL